MSTYHSVAHTHTHIQCSIARTSQCNWNNGKISHTGKRGNVEKRNMEKNNIFFFFYICSSGQMNRAGIKKEWITVPYHVYIHTFTKSKIMYHIDDISIPQATEKLLVRLLLYRWRTCIFDFCWINDFLSLSRSFGVVAIFSPFNLFRCIVLYVCCFVRWFHINFFFHFIFFFANHSSYIRHAVRFECARKWRE